MIDDEESTELEAPLSVEIWDNPCNGVWELPAPISLTYQVRTGTSVETLPFGSDECSFTVTLNACSPTIPNFDIDYWSIAQPTFSTITNPTVNVYNDDRVVMLVTPPSLRIFTGQFINTFAGTFTLDIVLQRDKTRIESADQETNFSILYTII